MMKARAHTSGKTGGKARNGLRALIAIVAAIAPAPALATLPTPEQFAFEQSREEVAKAVQTAKRVGNPTRRNQALKEARELDERKRAPNQIEGWVCVVRSFQHGVRAQPAGGGRPVVAGVPNSELHLVAGDYVVMRCDSAITGHLVKYVVVIPDTNDGRAALKEFKSGKEALVYGKGFGPFDAIGGSTVIVTLPTDATNPNR